MQYFNDYKKAFLFAHISAQTPGCTVERLAKIGGKWCVKVRR